MICDECETVAHCLKNGCVPKHQALERMAENARELGLDYEPVWCGNCNGSGRMVRDPDIGTDQECFVCDGAGVPSAPAQDNDAHYKGVVEGVQKLFDDKRAQPAPVQQSRSDVEPVAWRVKWPAIGGGHKWIMVDRPTMVEAGFVNEALYTTPPAAQRPWVGLTDEERMDILLNLNWDKKLSHMDTAQAIEAKLKEKNCD